MAVVELMMPSLGEGIQEGTILDWLKKEGDSVELEESIVEVATDKVDTEIPCMYEGIIDKIVVQKGEVAQVGKPIALIKISQATSTNDVSNTNGHQQTEPSAPEVEAMVQETIAGFSSTSSIEAVMTTRFYSPLVKSIAKKENISFEELEKIPGTGKDNRVTKTDIFAYLEQRKAEKPTPHIPAPSPAVSVNQGVDEVIEMDRMRKMIAERMISSQQTSAHVTSFVEADVTNIMSWRAKMKHMFMEREGLALTLTPIFIEAIVKTLKDYPMINSQVSGDKIIVKKDINIGMAVALPSGNLIVPVIHNADKLNLIGITAKVNDLAHRARKNELKAQDVTGGTYSVSNIGAFGNLTGTPIINQPQSAIMALGTVQKKPTVIETPQGDFIGIRQKMIISHTYDHRIIDGALGGMFAKKVADYLEGFDIERSL